MYIVCSMCMYVCVHVRMCVCASTLPCNLPMVAHHLLVTILGLTIWQESGRASCPLSLFCKPTIRIHNAYRQCNAMQEVVLAPTEK